MPFPTADEPLSEAEMDRLQDLLAARPQALNLEAMDGFFSALVAGPERITPGEAIPEALGESMGEAFRSVVEGDELVSLMARRWNEIARALAGDDVVLPILLDGEDGIQRANDWADGFLLATRMSRGWEVLLADEDHGGSMLAALVLHHEHDPDPSLRPPEITPEKRESLIVHLAAGIVAAYRYFRSDGYLAASAALAEADIGRNAPCPCGSGKRYKRCCGHLIPC